jgi:hypothetical protein
MINSDSAANGRAGMRAGAAPLPSKDNSLNDFEQLAGARTARPGAARLRFARRLLAFRDHSGGKRNMLDSKAIWIIHALFYTRHDCLCPERLSASCARRLKR